MTLSRQSGIAFLLSVVLGAFCGVLLILLWQGPYGADDLPFFLMMLPWATLTSLPYVAAALAVFGLSATWLLHRYVPTPWFGLVAAGWGWVAGSITYYWFDYIRYGGFNELAQLTGIQDLGPIYGVPTGLAWWLLYRQALSTRGSAPKR